MHPATVDENYVSISLTEHRDLIRCREQRDALVRMLADSESPETSLKGRGQALVAAARLAGLVLTIREESIPPLRMGHTHEVVSVRPMFIRAEE